MKRGPQNLMAAYQVFGGGAKHLRIEIPGYANRALGAERLTWMKLLQGPKMPLLWGKTISHDRLVARYFFSCFLPQKEFDLEEVSTGSNND